VGQRRRSQGVRVFFTLSVWNPYQVMLMSTILPRILIG
jgi:hypothetical protein